MRLARATAPPDMTMLPEAKVPKPKAVLSVSPWGTEMRRVDAELLAARGIRAVRSHYDFWLAIARRRNGATPKM